MLSIVMSFHNRREQLIATLHSIDCQGHDNIEVVCVDDCSCPEHRIEDLENRFHFLKVIRLDNKKTKSPCIPYNVGFSNARGNLIIIQNAECLHVGDIISSTRSMLSDGVYLSFGCYSLSAESSETVKKLIITDHEKMSSFISGLPQICGVANENSWYNHSLYSPRNYHFTTAITKKNLDELKGFDERYAFGMDYDDDEFLLRIKRKRLIITPIDNPFSAHLWHTSSYVDIEMNGENFNPQQLHNINANVFRNYTINELGWEACVHEHYNSNRN